MNTRQRILIRVAVLAAVWTGWQVGIELLATDEGGANIGAGLLAFGTVVAVAGGGALLDSRRLAIQTVLIIWSVSALAFGAVVGAWQGVRERGLETSALVSDTIGTAVFVGILVALPAVLGGVVGSSLRRASRID